jgi:nitroreductase
MDITEPVAERLLRMAAQVSLSAPSILNTQPWRWQVESTSLRLWADRSRQLLVSDPDGRLLTISCGAALHHARLALAMLGWSAGVERLPDSAQPDLLATIDLTNAWHDATDAERAAYEAIARRRTDRRAYGREPVAPWDADCLVVAAEEAGAHLHLIRDDDVAELGAAAQQAASIQFADAAYRKELVTWVEHRPDGAGVPAEAAVPSSPRRVPVRQFTNVAELDPGRQTDAGARYAVLYTNGDEPGDWLRAGEALSAVLLTATAAGLATAPISDVTETVVTRERLRRMLSGIGYPQMALRIGYAPPGTIPASPRRHPRDVIDS